MRIFTILLIFTSYIATAEVFKTINPDGSVSYSDVQKDDEKPISLPELTSTPAFKIPKKKVTPKKKTEKTALPYKAFSITSPKNQATIFSNTGSLNILVNIKPSLQIDFKHSITVLVDNKIAKSNLTTPGFLINGLDRGTHTVSAQIMDGNNKVIKSSSAITIFLKRHSILHGKTTTLWPEL